MSIHRLQSRFLSLLRPVAGRLAAAGVTANQITVYSVATSVAIGLFLLAGRHPAWFLLVPLWLLVRMAFDATGDMLAREHGQKSGLLGYLNEIGDVVSDAALLAPFALVSPFSPVWIAAVIFLATLTEFAGVLGAVHGKGRCHDGPMGRGDRAFVFGIVGIWAGVAGSLPELAFWLMPALCLSLVVTVVKRVQPADPAP